MPSTESRLKNIEAWIEPTSEADFEGEQTLVVTYNGRQEYRTPLLPAEARKVLDALRSAFNFE